MTDHDNRLDYSEVLKLQRWNTPTIYNGWEQITKKDAACDCFNLEETHDFMTQNGPMAGYAVTVMIQPSKKAYKKENPNAWEEYRQYIDSVPGPKIVVTQDLDKPQTFGSFWGEVNASFHRALGCIGTITDGAIRDLDEMTAVGFKAVARRLCVGHAHAWPVQWNCDVNVFGTAVQPGQLIHADKHGFLAIPPEDEQGLLKAALFMDNNELETVISSGKHAIGTRQSEILSSFSKAGKQFDQKKYQKFEND